MGVRRWEIRTSIFDLLSPSMDTTFQIQAPHEAALALLKGKKPVASEVFYELLPELRARAFTVGGVACAGTLQRCRDAVAGIATGDTWDEAKKTLIQELDPWLGDGSAQRAETLLRTHGFQAFAAASHQTSIEDEDVTHFQYLTMEDDRVRDSHAALDGLVLPKDDPFWDTHTPPWEWGCRCMKRAMNVDQVGEEMQKDEGRNPEDQNVITGPALTQLRHGTLMREGQRFDVSEPHGDEAYHFNPDDLHLSLADLAERYDPEVFSAFKKWAANTDIDKHVTVLDWLGGAPAQPAPPPQNNLVVDKVKAAKLSKEIQEQAAALPVKAVKVLSTAEFHPTRGGAYYNRSDRGIRLHKDPENWNGSPHAFHHESGHHFHYETGLVNSLGQARPDFAAAIQSDFDAWQKLMEKNHGPGWRNIYKRTNVYQMQDVIGKTLDNAGDLNSQVTRERISRISDTIMGLSGGKYGFGHKLSYMQMNGAKEVAAHAYSAVIQEDETFKKLFPNVVNVLKQELAL
jgi:SPP1 gp7 family putative phage head morphogenesis protein